MCQNKARVWAKYCNTCRSRKYDPPLKRMWWNLKSHAKARGKTFALAWETFRKLAVSSGYVDAAGRQVGDLQIDRIDAGRGYVEGNVRVIPVEENARKGWLERNAPWRQSHAGEAFSAEDLNPF